MTPVHPIVEGVVETYLEAVDAEAPGLVEGLYLTGSVALGEFRPRTSDIDFLAVTKRRTGASAAAALGKAHGRLRTRWPSPCFDGLYVTWAELAHDPAAAGRGPFSDAGRYYARGDRAGDPVTWQTVAQHGVACRGPQAAALTIHTDPQALARWTLNNLDTYWHELLAHASRFPHPRT